jgi:hypothetical protein
MSAGNDRSVTIKRYVTQIARKIPSQIVPLLVGIAKRHFIANKTINNVFILFFTHVILELSRFKE